jgi:hydrogenase maturation factor
MVVAAESEALASGDWGIAELGFAGSELDERAASDCSVDRPIIGGA